MACPYRPSMGLRPYRRRPIWIWAMGQGHNGEDMNGGPTWHQGTCPRSRLFGRRHSQKMHPTYQVPCFFTTKQSACSSYFRAGTHPELCSETLVMIWSLMRLSCSGRIPPVAHSHAASSSLSSPGRRFHARPSERSQGCLEGVRRRSCRGGAASSSEEEHSPAGAQHWHHLV